VFDDLFGSESSSTDVDAKSTAVKPVKSQPTGEELQAQLNNDLRKWQTKFATAADKGSEDLEQRVAEITKRQVESGVKGHGRALVVKLEETADSTVANLKSFIKRTVESLPEDATEEDYLSRKGLRTFERGRPITTKRPILWCNLPSGALSKYLKRYMALVSKRWVCVGPGSTVSLTMIGKTTTSYEAHSTNGKQKSKLLVLATMAFLLLNGYLCQDGQRARSS
jgi:hypothetical protein